MAPLLVTWTRCLGRGSQRKALTWSSISHWTDSIPSGPHQCLSNEVIRAAQDTDDGSCSASSSLLVHNPMFCHALSGGFALSGVRHNSSFNPSQQQHVRRFFSFPSPQQLKDEFFSPDRAATSYLMTASIVTTLLTFMNHRLLSKLSQFNSALAKGEWYRLLTAPLCHGGILHLGANMLALHYLGPPVEYAVGKTCFTAIYFSGAIGGGLMHYYYGSYYASVIGSSAGYSTVTWLWRFRLHWVTLNSSFWSLCGIPAGAIAGLFSAYVVYKLRNKHVLGWSSADTSYVGQMVAINVVLSLALGGAVAHWAHLGGLAGGAVSMYLLGPRLIYGRGGYVEDRPLIPIFKNMP